MALDRITKYFRSTTADVSINNYMAVLIYADDSTSSVSIDGQKYTTTSGKWVVATKSTSFKASVKIEPSGTGRAIILGTECLDEIKRDNTFLASTYGVWDGADGTSKDITITTCLDDNSDPLDTTSRWEVPRGESLNLDSTQISNTSGYIVFARSDGYSAVMANGFSKTASTTWAVAHKLSKIETLDIVTFGSTRSVIRAVDSAEFDNKTDSELLTTYLGDTSTLDATDSFEPKKYLGNNNQEIKVTSDGTEFFVVIAHTENNGTTSSATVNGTQYVTDDTWRVLVRLSKPSDVTVTARGSTLTILSTVSEYDFINLTDAQIISKYGGYYGDKVLSPKGEIQSTTTEMMIVETRKHKDDSSLDDIVALTDQELLDKYNDKVWEQRVDVKKEEINNHQASTDSTLSDLETLRSELSLYNNFTQDQLIERNQFIIHREWSDNMEIDDVKLKDNALLKFDEMRLPKDVLTIDIVDFFEITTEKRNWDKLTIGDTILIDYEKLGVKVKAKIIEISYNYEDDNIKLKIANVQDLNGVSNDWLKQLYESLNVSATVGNNQWKWDKVEATDGKVNSLINDFWTEIGEVIHAGTQNDIQISNRGIWIQSTQNPDNMLVANNSVLAISNDGGNSWKNAITWKGIVAERLYGKHIIGANLWIEHEDGIFSVNKDGVTIDGQKLNIIGKGIKVSDLIDMDDFRQRVEDRIGDKFTYLEDMVRGIDLDTDLEGVVLRGVTYNGVQIDSYNGLTITGYKPEDYVNGEPTTFTPASIINLNGSHGMTIYQNQAYEWGGEDWQQTFWLDTMGTLMTRNMKTFNLMIQDEKDGYFLFDGNHMVVSTGHGGSNVAHFGYLPHLHDLGLEIETRRSRLYVTRNKNFELQTRTDTGWQKVMWVEDNGDLYANNVYSKNITLMSNKIDELTGLLKPVVEIGEEAILDLTAFDKVIVEDLFAENIEAIKVTALYGFIRDLVVSKVVTNDRQKDIIDYIAMEEHELKFITGTFLGYGEQVYYNEKPLYIDANGGYTFEVTDTPLRYELTDEYVKMKIHFSEEAENRTPIIDMGAGTGVSEVSGKARIMKNSKDFSIRYYDGVNSKQRHLYLRDTDVELALQNSVGGMNQIYMNDNKIKLSVTDGTNESFIEITTTDINIKSNGVINITTPEE